MKYAKYLLVCILMIMLIGIKNVNADLAPYNLTPSSATIGIGEELQLVMDVGEGDRVKCIGANGNYSSANTSVATVNSDGVVTGVSTGVVIITYSPCSELVRTSTITVVDKVISDNPSTGSILSIVTIIVSIIAIALSVVSFNKIK